MEILLAKYTSKPAKKDKPNTDKINVEIKKIETQKAGVL